MSIGPVANAPVATRDETTILTPGVEVIPEGHITLARITERLKDARAADEEVHRDPAQDPFGVDLFGVCERSIKLALGRKRMDARTAEARRSTLRRFILLTGVQSVTDVQPHHLQLFFDRLQALPKSFGRSSKDADRSLQDILERARGLPANLVGREPGTINRDLDTVSAILGHAAGQEGSAVRPGLDVGPLRLPETKRGRAKRHAFRPDEVNRLFAHPVWTGNKGPTRRHTAGDHILRDALYWVPLIVRFTGCRMEEVAALPVDSIIEHEGAWALDIVPHELRPLKTLQSERLLPLHRQLIDLGLAAHLKEQRLKGERWLFSDLVPKAGDPGQPAKKFARALRYHWRKVRERQFDGNPRGLDGHGLRHTLNQYLKDNRDVSRQVRLDILGHGGTDLNEEVYGAAEGSSFESKRSAIATLPRLSI